MPETDPNAPDGSKPPDPVKSGRAKEIVLEMDLRFGSGAAKPLATARAVEAPRPLSERWRLTPDGRVRDSGASEVHCVVAAVIHLWPILASAIGPVALVAPPILWLAFRARSPLVDDHGREAMNAMASLLVLVLVPCFGWAILVAWLPIQLVSIVRAAVAGGTGELFRYPVILRPIR